MAYNRELYENNQALKKQLQLLEWEIKRLLPAAFFLRTRDMLRRQIQKCVGLIEACQKYRGSPKKENAEKILVALRRLEEEEKM